MEGASFGAGRAGGAIDPVDFLKQPQTLLRVTTWIFSIVVFGSIINECYVNKDSKHPELLCIFNENESACSYGIAVGVIAFFGCIFFFVVDLYFQQISSVKDRKRAGADAARAAITFSFFSIIIWAVLALRALQRYRLGTDMSLFATEQFGTEPGASYPGYPGGSGVESTETYQSPPFTETLEPNPKGYQVPAY
ncbi:hypothetical protein DV515_00014795 [Chloebia gouldiae]|uniref:MARVEL domain-containing protein n=1 Tax=Chloebia gouldiae TaxID=44316 RepID=A0A3L8RX69_CHLGU|nr:hypothetical protein DV515_00014795 [Chloebia gouldiae]